MNTQSSLMSTPTSLPSVVLPSISGNPPEEMKWEKHTWLLIPSPDVRGQTSGIWQHGHQYLRQDGLTEILWRCSHCQSYCLKLGKRGGRFSTGNSIRHLRRKHHIEANTDVTLDEEEEEDEEVENLDKGKGRSEGFKTLYTTVNFDNFRFHLIRWIVERHIPFSVVKDRNFQLMLKSLNESIDGKMVKNGDSIHDWIEQEFIKSKGLVIRDVLMKARSKIHLSCDLWSSPNGYAICGIAAHFVGHQGTIQSVLLGMKRMMAAHSGEQIANHIIDVIDSFGIGKALGVFVADNAESNDTAWRAVLRKIDPDRVSEESRLRCVAYIINLAAKEFIFGKHFTAVEAATNLVNDLTPLDSKVMKDAQEAWRRIGPLGKVHNIIRFIRASPQRKEAFK